jgi:hypothetical protein
MYDKIPLVAPDDALAPLNPTRLFPTVIVFAKIEFASMSVVVRILNIKQKNFLSGL